jgi:hypothetical protein
MSKIIKFPSKEPKTLSRLERIQRSLDRIDRLMKNERENNEDVVDLRIRRAFKTAQEFADKAFDKEDK